MAWLGTWGNRIKLTIDSSKVDTANLTNFPVMVYLSAASGIGDVDASCVFDELTSDANRKKIAVTSSDGTTELYVEIERWDDANEKAWLHVKVPTVSYSADTVLYLYFDSSHADNTTYIGDIGSTPGQAVWDSNFKAVYHMAQDPNGDVTDAIKDSTSNANDGTPNGSMTTSDLVDGKVGKGIDFDGTDDTVQTPAITISQLTIMIVCKHSSSLDWDGIAVASDDSSSDWWQITNGPSGKMKFNYSANGSGTGENVYVGDSVVNDDAFHMLTGTVDNTPEMKLFVDGEIDTPYSKTWDTLSAVSTIVEEVKFATIRDDVYYGDTIICEVRISDIARSAAWIKATYHSLWDSLITFEVEEPDNTVSAAPFTGTFELTAGGAKVTSNQVGAVPLTLTGTLSTPTIKIISRTLFNGTLSLVNSLKLGSTLTIVNSLKLGSTLTIVNSLKLGSTLTIVNSLNTIITFDIRLVLNILSKIEGTQTLRLDINELAKFDDTLSLINHILDADSGITQGDYYFLKSHGL
jgi:hypothetical protein